MQAYEQDKARQGRHQATLYGVAALEIALNVGLGAIVFLVKLPIYLDAVGTIAVALLSGALGWRGFALSALVGAASFALTVLLLNPVAIWFVPTQVAIAAYSFWIARPVLRAALQAGSFGGSAVARVIAVGIGLGVVAGLVSAPIIVWVFGGITGSGASLVVAMLLKSGETIYQSVLASGLASEPLDKTLQLSAAIALVMATPRRIRAIIR